MDEQRVKLAAEECLKVWTSATASKNRPTTAAAETAETAPTIHLACSVFELGADIDIDIDIHGGNGTCAYASVKGTTYSLPYGYKTSSASLSVRSVTVLDVGSKNAATVHVGGIADDDEEETLQGWLVFLLDNDQWKCISAAFSRDYKFTSIRPEDFSAVTALTWDGYCGANRACDGVAMAKVFHETCRLTKADNNVVLILSQKVFCQKVTHRYSQEEMHIPYAHLQNDPRAAERDSLLCIDFATSDLAMVTLKVGHPPCLWTDILTCAKINGQWWIVHKSSCCEPFLVDLKQK
jgi:hypothetical protein